MPSSRSQRDLRSVSGNLPAGALGYLALGGDAQQRRVGIVDMQKYLSLDTELGQGLDSAGVARHCNMSHALPCLVAEAGSDQLVIPPHRAIEEYQRGAGKPGLEFVRHLSAGGKKIQRFACRLVADTKPERIARAIGPGGVSLPFQIPRALAGNGEWQDLDAGARTIRQGWLERLVHLNQPALHVLLVQHVEDAVGLQDRKHPPVRIDS